MSKYQTIKDFQKSHHELLARATLYSVVSITVL